MHEIRIAPAYQSTQPPFISEPFWLQTASSWCQRCSSQWTLRFPSTTSSSPRCFSIISKLCMMVRWGGSLRHELLKEPLSCLLELIWYLNRFFCKSTGIYHCNIKSGLTNSYPSILILIGGVIISKITTIAWWMYAYLPLSPNHWSRLWACLFSTSISQTL